MREIGLAFSVGNEFPGVWLLRVRIVVRCVQAEIHAADFLCHVAVFDGRRQAQGQVGIEPRQRNDLRLAQDRQLDLRMAFGHAAQIGGQEVARQDRRRGDPDLAMLLRTGREHDALRSQCACLHQRHLFQHLMSDLGQARLAHKALNQAYLQRLFQRRQPAAHGGIVDAQHARRAGERTCLGNGLKIAEVFPVHDVCRYAG